MFAVIFLQMCTFCQTLISMCSIDLCIGTKFGPKSNKEATFLSTSLPNRFNTVGFIVARLLFETLC